MSTFKIVTAKELRARDLILETRTDEPFNPTRMFKIERPDPQKLYEARRVNDDAPVLVVTRLIDEMVTAYLGRGGDLSKLEFRVFPGTVMLNEYELRLSGQEKP
jgi:hypothetical protein